MKDFSFTLKNGRLRFRGVSFGYGDSDPYLVFHKDDYMVARKPSTRDWSQLGSTSVYPSTWWILRVAPEEENRFRVVEVVHEENPGSAWRRLKMLLVLQVEELCARKSESSI
jgi:hypothetical protein